MFNMMYERASVGPLIYQSTNNNAPEIHRNTSFYLLDLDVFQKQ